MTSFLSSLGLGPKLRALEYTIIMMKHLLGLGLLALLYSCNGQIEAEFISGAISSATVQGSSQSLVVSWDVNKDGTMVTIEKSVDGGAFQQIAVVDSTDGEYEDKDTKCVDAETTIVYRFSSSNDPDKKIEKTIVVPRHPVKKISYGYTSDNTTYSKGIWDLTSGASKLSLNGDNDAIASSVLDTYLRVGDNSDYGSTTAMTINDVDGFVLRYDDFSNQIIARIGNGQKIKSAKLKVYLYGSDRTISIYPAIMSWSESDTYVSLGLASIDDIKGSSLDSFNYVFASHDHNYGTVFDVTSEVQKWINGESNNGFVIQSDSGTIGFKTLEYTLTGGNADTGGKGGILEIEYYDESGV